MLWSSQLTGLVCYGQQVCDEEGMSVLLQVRTIAEIGAWSLEVEDLLHWAAPRSGSVGFTLQPSLLTQETRVIEIHLSTMANPSLAGLHFR